LPSSPIDYSGFIEALQKPDDSPFTQWALTLAQQCANGLSTQRFGDLPKWYTALESLPTVKAAYSHFGDRVTIGKREQLDDAQWQHLYNALTELIPWRKGPFEFFGIHIDTEWRSDWKWQRLKKHISNLQGRTVLDVGCGNGYHCWRMHEQGAARVIGIDPSPRFIVQFYMVKHFLEHCPVDILPIGIEGLPPHLAAFDTTFSMGVLYHRRSPMDHLLELKNTLCSGGELVLETLVIEGGLGDVLVPEGRYAKMNNVWFLPSVPTLISWLQKCGFDNVRCVDCTLTSTEEQRSTDWMKFQSLPDYLSLDDDTKTVEGHPRPMRAVLIANKK